jgi:hypothetical protein
MRRVTLALALILGIVAAPVVDHVYATTTTTSSISFSADQQLLNLQQPDVLGVQELEPGIKTDQAGDIFVNAIRGVPAGSDIWIMHTTDCVHNLNNVCPEFYAGQPEAYQGTAGTSGNSGGGDIDMDVGQPYAINDCSTGIPTCPGAGHGNLYMASLTLANNTAVVCRAVNLSASSCTVPNTAGTTTADEDREWVAAEGKHTAYLSFHNVGPDNITVCKSTNDLQTIQAYALCTQALNPTDTTGLGTALADNQLGNLVVDNFTTVAGPPVTCVSPPCHYLYQIYLSTLTPAENVAGCPLHVVWMAVSNDDGATFTNHKVYDDTTSPSASCAGTVALNSIFPSVAVDQAGNVYAEWTNGTNIFYSSSTDHGTTWDGKTDGSGAPTQVSQTFGTPNCDSASPSTTCGLQTSIMPWIAAGAAGHVDFVWYGSSTTQFSSTGPVYGCQPTDVHCPSGVNPPAWSVFFAETFNGTANATGNATAPIIQQTIASHHANHIGEICTGGTNCSAGRTLGDFFQVAIEHGNYNSGDPNDTQCAVIAYANDIDTFISTQAYFNRQTSNCTSAPTASPVSRVRSEASSSGIHYTWHASTARTAGFNILAQGPHNTVYQLNTRLIAGSRIDSRLESVFRYYARRAHVRWFYLDQVSATGTHTRYGPYKVGSKYM